MEIKTAFPWRVRNDYVAVRPDDPEEKTKGGILIPENSSTPPLTGKVIGVGASVTDIKAGQTVLFSKHSGAEVEIKYLGRKVVLMRQEHVRMVLVG